MVGSIAGVVLSDQVKCGHIAEIRVKIGIKSLLVYP